MIEMFAARPHFNTLWRPLLGSNLARAAGSLLQLRPASARQGLAARGRCVSESLMHNLARRNRRA